MIRLLPKLTAGHFRRHRLEALLCLVGIALGVAVVVGIDAAVLACVHSFEGAVKSLAGRATHSIYAEQGTLPDETYLDLVRGKLPYPLAPVIERGVLASGANGEDLVARLIGVDVFAEKSLRSFTQVQSSLDKDALRTFLTRPGQVVMSDALATRLGVSAGSTLQLTVGGHRRTVAVAGLLTPTGVARAQMGDLILADIATAQELTDSLGRIDRIDTNLADAGQEKALGAALPPGLILKSTEDRSAQLAELVKSYKLNLNALSLMASFVAVFIVYNSMLVSVQQRAVSLGILRCLGGSRAQLASIYLTEALLFSIVGGAIGVLGGWALSAGLVKYIGTTINDLYGAVRPGPVRLDAVEIAEGMGVSLVSGLLGAVVPLVQAARTPPVGAFRGTARARASGRASITLLGLGLALLGLSYGVYVIPGNSPVAGFVMAMFVALGFAFTCPAITSASCWAIGKVAHPLQLLPAQMAAAGVARSLAITGVAGAAMMLAMAMNVGIRTMVASFHDALSTWMDQRFSADIFVGPELLVNHKIDAALDPAVGAWVRRRPEVKQVIEYRAHDAPFEGKPILLVGTDTAALLASNSLPIKSIVGGRPFDPARDAVISEPLSGRAKLTAGDTMNIDSPTGPRQFNVYAVFYDFGNERGEVLLDRRTYAAGWRDDSVNSLHVRLMPGADPETLSGQWEKDLRKDYPVVAHSFRHVKGEVMQIFDRTFAVTNVLGWLAGGVAFCGLSGSLLSLALGRRRDYSILAAVGMSGRQTAAWVLGQGLIIAWVATAVAAVAGTALAYVLAYVIQYRSFGWSIPTHPRPRLWAEIFVLATASAIIAAIYPVARLRATPPAGNLREE